jgi:hypothetical protein
VDSEDESPPTSTSTRSRDQPVAKPTMGAKVKKGVVLSDDDEVAQPSRRIGKRASETEKRLRAMMDVDDGAGLCVLRRLGLNLVAIQITSSVSPKRRSTL